MLHGKKLAIVVACDLHKECCEGKVEPDWKVEKPVGFHRFREKLALQMLAHDSSKMQCPGDEKSRKATKQGFKRRRVPHTPPRSCSSVSFCTTASVDTLRSESTRFCGDLSDIQDHIRSVWSLGKNTRKCEVCGQPTTQVCGRCDSALHFQNTPEGFKVPCFFHYHDSGFVGLARTDCKAMGTPKKVWRMPNDTTIERNRKALKRASSVNKEATETDDRDVDYNNVI